MGCTLNNNVKVPITEMASVLHGFLFWKSLSSPAKWKVWALFPHRFGDHPSPGLPAGPRSAITGMFLTHLSGPYLESRKPYRTQLSLGGPKHVLCRTELRGAFPGLCEHRVLAGSLCSAPTPPQEPLKAGDLGSGPLVGGELPGTVQRQGFPRM